MLSHNFKKEDYISSLLRRQTTSLKEMKPKYEDLVNLVERKKFNLRRDNRITYNSLVKDDELDSSRKIDRLLQMKEEIRKLKVEVSGLVTAIDSFGDYDLGHENVRRPPRRSTSQLSMGRALAAPPPIPPKPSLNKLQSQVSQNSEFNELSVRVPRSGRRPPDILAFNSYTRMTSTTNSTSPRTPIQTTLEETVAPSKPHWNCVKCSFANHPDLNFCEMCEATKNLFYTSI